MTPAMGEREFEVADIESQRESTVGCTCITCSLWTPVTKKYPKNLCWCSSDLWRSTRSMKYNVESTIVLTQEQGDH